MQLSGHSGEIFASKFDPTGNNIASGSMDRSICKFYALFFDPHFVCMRATNTNSLQCYGGPTATARTTGF